MKKLIFIVLTILPILCKAPPLINYYKDLKTHYYWLEQEELRKEKEFQNFLFHLSMRESSNQWNIINKYGYIGKYQFGNSTLKAIGLGHITTKKFRKNPLIFPEDLQEIAIKKLLVHNDRILSKYYRYNNTYINNVKITRSGLLAASHLAGAYNVIKFLKSNGKYDFADANGTKISNYLNEFKNYKF